MALNDVLEMVQVISKSVQEHAAIAIADQKSFVYYHPGKEIDLPIHPGDQLREETASFQALLLKDELSLTIDSTVFGVPYMAHSLPIKEKNEIKGCITTIYPLKRKREVGFAQSVPLNFLVGKMEDRFLPITFSDIHYIYSDQGKTILHTKRGTFQNKYTLSQLEEMLPQHQFLRCHRSYIVNLEAIEEIHPHFHSTFKLSFKETKTRIPVGQTYASLFRHILGF